MLTKRVWKDQFDACGLVAISIQLKLAHISAAAKMDDSKLKWKKPSKVQLKQLSEVNQRIYEAKWVQFSSLISLILENGILFHFPKSSHWGLNITNGSK